MTKEEALKVLMKMRAWRRWGKGEQNEKDMPEMPEQKEVDEAFDVFIETLSQSFLPSNLDEAAEESSKNTYPYEDDNCVYDRVLVDEAREYHECGFKAGAEWMAGQGVTLEGRVCKDEYVAEAPFYYVETENSDDLPIVGDKVVVQIRKK